MKELDLYDTGVEFVTGYFRRLTQAVQCLQRGDYTGVVLNYVMRQRQRTFTASSSASFDKVKKREAEM